MLPLTFADPNDYGKIKEDDTFDLTGLDTFEAGKPLKLTINHADGSKEEILLNHTISTSQFEWFKAGSALNLIAQQNK
jgi:aconitate hydratase